MGHLARRVADWSAAGAGDAQALRPLTSEFDVDQHRDYVDYLNAALLDDKIRNIALTGRYGSGKSSVLEQFARENRRRLLLLSMSSLGPEEGPAGGARELPAISGPGGFDHARVNQIQKELVKQLLHREPPSKLPQSRYQRIERLTLGRALTESAAALITVFASLWLFDALPNVPRLADHAPAWTWVPAAVATVAAISVVAWLRLAVHNRLEVSQVSAAGASVTLTKKADSYFDQYLDEIVYFFESRPAIDVVVFEDLDRFNEAGIFEALRELNTLLNSSRQVTRRGPWRRRTRTIRFVYALRDSIFEQLGHDTKELDDDAAQAEAVRANRTKFFDLVVPLVPFITHRTARELLAKALTDDRAASVPVVSDELVDVAARHIPDMRLLKNIRNEYAVFAKRLITDGHGMDTLSPDQLFAMVVYKNLHLEDFELILLGRSKLDTLYKHSRRVVNANIAYRRAKLRTVSDDIAAQKAKRARARKWGERLDWFSEKITEASAHTSVTEYLVDGTEHETTASGTVEFWQAVLDANVGINLVTYNSRFGTRLTVALEMSELREIVGENAHPRAGLKTANELLVREQAALLADLEVLQTADFEQLAKRPDLIVGEEGETEAFADLFVGTIDSELGQVLIADGYINRYYNMYIAQYYGDRLPPNAMSFIVQNVDPNRSDFNYSFDGPEEIAALLKETKRSFLEEQSAYNIDILDYLLKQKDEGAHTILDSATRRVASREQAFLDAYLGAGEQSSAAVGYLAERWAGIFAQIIDRAELTDYQRVDLVNAALAHSSSEVDYDLEDPVREFLQNNYRQFSTIADSADPLEDEQAAEIDEVSWIGEVVEALEDDTPSPEAIANAIATLNRAGFICDDLGALRKEARRPVVKSDCYALTAANLRSILGDDISLSLDAVQAADLEVYRDLLERPDEYIEARVLDAASEFGRPTDEMVRGVDARTIERPDAFVPILADIASLTSDQAVQVIELSNPACAVQDLADVPDSLWEILARFGRFPVTLSNVGAYAEYLGEVDEHLARLLTEAGKIDITEESENGANAEESADEERADVVATEDAKARIAELVLSAAAHIPDPCLRARLAASLELQRWLSVDKVPAEHGPLLGYVIEQRVCSDAAATFAHFEINDWTTLGFAIQHSAKFPEFVTPALLPPRMARRLLESSEMSEALKIVVLGRFDEFVPSDDSATLTAAGGASLKTDLFLGASRIRTIASGTEDADLVMAMTNHYREQLSTDEVIDILVHVGGKYGQLLTLGEKLNFPRTDDHEAVFQRLRAEGRITSRAHAKTLTKPARIDVEVL
ncbi:hypothetical protein NOCA2570017 [metagenome]|uniref:YobI-like P-loop NTPase domain-containing protein n=1 Tax=metagenome TaxID=256318 RepID=A0A2P2CAU8_9ZZZZ